jgi:hypothetical protein
VEGERGKKSEKQEEENASAFSFQFRAVAAKVTLKER